MADNEVIKGCKEKLKSLGREIKALADGVPTVKRLLIMQFAVQTLIMMWMIRYPDWMRSQAVAKLAPPVAIIASLMLHFEEKTKISTQQKMALLLVFTVCFGMVTVQIMNPHWCESVVFALALSAASLTLAYGFGAYTTFELQPFEKPFLALLLVCMSLAAFGDKFPLWGETAARGLLYASGFAVFITVVQKTDGSGLEDVSKYNESERIWLALTVHSALIIIFAATYAVVRRAWRY